MHNVIVPFLSADIDTPIITDVPELAQQQFQLFLAPQQCRTVATDPRDLDINEEKKVREFCANGCGCSLVKGRPCSFQFSREHYQASRANAAELSWNELNMAVMGQVMALTCCDPLTMNSAIYRHTPRERQRAITLFHHQGHRVCRTTFLVLHGIGEYRFKAIKQSYLSEGLVPRTHGHTGRIAPNSLVQKDVQQIISFVTHYTETNAILLPGRIPGYKRDDIQLLSSTTTKKAVWRLYQDTCSSLSVRAAGYSTFCKVWRHFLPHVIVARPMTDLCWTCQQNSTAIVRSAGLSEAEKSKVSIHTITVC